MKFLKFMLCGTASLLIFPDIALAENSENVDEIVVTARKREERLQDVPLSVSALTANQMAQRQVRDTKDIAALTPGLNFEGYLGASGTPVIRGASQQRITDLDQNVSSFFDGIYLPRAYAVNLGVIGLERVEVVKGPQSALYGRNAFMGAINYVSKKPGNDWAATVELTGGLYERFDVLADASGPLVKDKLFVRVGFGLSKFDGDQINGNPNANADISPGSPGRVNGWDNKSYQGRLIFKPTDTISLDFGFYRFEVFQETPAIVRLNRSFGDTNCGATLSTGRRSFYCGALPYRFSPLPGGAQPSVANVDPRGYGLDSTSTILVGKAAWQPSDQFSFSYDYGRVKSDAISGGGSDRDPVLGSANIFVPTAPRGNQFQISPVGNVSYWSHELRAEYSPVSSLTLMIGGLKSKLNDFDEFPIAGGLPLLGTAPFDIRSSDFRFLSRGRTIVDTKAVFGSVNWQATDKLRFAAEARYQAEDKMLTSGTTTIRVLTGTWHQFTPRFTVDYKINPDSLVYVTAAKGEKSGGFNTSAILPAQFSFDTDHNWTYEVGLKNELLDGKIRLNAAAFYVDWANRQVTCSASGAAPGAIGPGVVCNIGKSTVKGFELSSTWVAAKGLNINAGIAYNDAHYANGVIDQRLRDFAVCDGIVCAVNGDVSGKQLERQSKLQASFGTDYTVSLGGKLSGFAGIDANYKSKQFSDTANAAFLPARWLVDARVGVRSDAWTVTLWAKNLLNLQYAAASFFTLAATDTSYVPIKGANRTAGLTAKYNF